MYFVCHVVPNYTCRNIIFLLLFTQDITQLKMIKYKNKNVLLEAVGYKGDCHKCKVCARVVCIYLQKCICVVGAPV